MMKDTMTARNKDLFNSFDYYLRTQNRRSDSYKDFVTAAGREPNIIYPAGMQGFYNFDIDKVLVGAGNVHFGFMELKQFDKLERPFVWNDKNQRDYIKQKLVESDFQISYMAENFSHPNVDEFSDVSKLSVIPGKNNYSKYLKARKKQMVDNKLMGKGACIFLFYSKDCHYFCPVDFTNSKYVTGEAGYGVRGEEFKEYLKVIGERLEPCFNEFLLWFLLMGIVENYDWFDEYLESGLMNDQIRIDEPWEDSIIDEFNDTVEDLWIRWEVFSRFRGFLKVMINADNILEHNDLMKELADYVSSGDIVDIFDKVYSEVKDAIDGGG